MRSLTQAFLLGSSVLVVAGALVACGVERGNPGGSGDDDGSGGGSGSGSGMLPPPARGFQVTTPEVTIMPHQEVTYCYYFRTPNTENLVIKRWESVLAPGSHHLIMYTTATDAMPPGTFNTQECGGFSARSLPAWTYATQTPTNSLELPQDDGTGKPLGQEIPAAMPAYFQMHYLNPSDQPIVARATLNADAYDAGAPYTPTAPYITYNANLNIPAHAVNFEQSATCSVPPNVQFWLVSTHSHKQSVKTIVKDGAQNSTNIVFSSTDWEHPGAQMFAASPFYTFATNQLTYQCNYTNMDKNQNFDIMDGPSADKNEMCMATGYYFPGTRARTCFTNALIP